MATIARDGRAMAAAGKDNAIPAQLTAGGSSKGMVGLVTQPYPGHHSCASIAGLLDMEGADVDGAKESIAGGLDPWRLLCSPLSSPGGENTARLGP